MSYAGVKIISVNSDNEIWCLFVTSHFDAIFEQDSQNPPNPESVLWEYPRLW